MTLDDPLGKSAAGGASLASAPESNSSTSTHRSYRVRQFKSADSHTVRSLYKNGLGQSGETESERIANGWYVDDKLQTDMADIAGSYIDRPGANFWVVVHVVPEGADGTETIAGFVGCIPVEPKTAVPKELVEKFGADVKVCELLRMTVAKEHQRKGLGQVLVNALTDWATEESQGYDVCLLGTLSTNNAALGLYRSCGFENLGAPFTVQLQTLSKDPAHANVDPVQIQNLFKPLHRGTRKVTCFLQISKRDADEHSFVSFGFFLKKCTSKPCLVSTSVLEIDLAQTQTGTESGHTSHECHLDHDYLSSFVDPIVRVGEPVAEYSM